MVNVEIKDTLHPSSTTKLSICSAQNDAIIPTAASVSVNTGLISGLAEEGLPENDLGSHCAVSLETVELR